MVIKENVRDFNTQHIFDCGQCFRWEREDDGSYTGVAFGRPANIRFEAYKEDGEEGRLLIDNIDETEFEKNWTQYLDLDTDYGNIKKLLSDKDEVMKQVIASGQGIRILRQEPWEAVVSFIISQNNNIPRIKKCIEGLCRLFGAETESWNGRRYYAFPSAEVLAEKSEDDLSSIKLGYRAKYIIETAKQVVLDNRLEKLHLEDFETGYQYLTGLHGVGPKVANCILLFGIGKHSSFPIDVWMRRVMNKMYGIDEGDLKSMQAYAEEHFGKYGGIAQQYLFYHIRQSE